MLKPLTLLSVGYQTINKLSPFVTRKGVSYSYKVIHKL